MRRPIAAGVLLVGCLALLWQCTGAFQNEANGDPVTIFGPWLEADADAFAASVDGVADDIGREIRYTGSLDFQNDLRERVAAVLDLPDLAAVPQPGLIEEMVASGTVVPFSDEVVDAIEANYTPGSWTEVNGEVYALPYRIIAKSLVWYRPAVFAEHDWAIPSTLDELAALVDTIDATDGVDPWCFGIFSGDDTGWPATDWVEDLILRRGGVELYDGWVAGDVGFTDPTVQAAFEEFRELVLAPGRTNGGKNRILGTGLRAIDDPLFAPDPGCALYKQASFGTIWFPDGTQIGPDGDVDAFVLPGVDEAQPAPVVVSADSIVQFTDDPDVDGVMAYLASPDGAREWAARGGYLSTRASVDPERYYRPNDRRLAEVLLRERDLRFDASDRLPTAVRDAFFEQITAWIAGAVTYDELAATLDGVRSPDE